MKRNYLSGFILCIGLLGLPAGIAVAEELTHASAINKAGMQRMLTQRIGKAYCQLGLGIEPEESQQQLFDAVELFDTHLAELGRFASSKEVQTTLQQIRELWLPIRAVATGPVMREGAKHVAYWNDDLLHASNKLVQLLQDDSDTAYARLVNISGRQRMLSQRLAKLYMLRVWGIDTLTIRDEMERAKNEFSGALAVLKAAPENTDKIRRQLSSVAYDWDWFRKALEMMDTDPFPKTVAGISESILVGMDQATGLYQKVAEKAHYTQRLERENRAKMKVGNVH